MLNSSKSKMAAFSDSDEDETFVTLGTPLDIPEEDAPRRKPVQVQDIQAKDSKGRPRFHGAFTGGFSAGYFNSVGSQKGFAPSTFVSSREKRAEGNDQRKPEDFMDEEDLGEYGIAPRKLVTAGKFSSEERKRRRQDELTVTAADSIIPGDALLLDLIVPERITIGVKLLRKMGWKEGQGVGPRLSRKQKKRQKAGMRVYGCEMPPSPGSDDDGMDDETLLNNLTYAPGDTTPIHLSVKDNSHGLGYRGLDPRNALPSSHLQLFEPPRIKKEGRKKGIRGQGFGVGALEDEDEDIYGVDDMSNYDMTMGGEEQDANFGWTAPGKRGPADTPVDYVGKVLEGFTLSSTKLVQTKLFPPPQLPRGYRPFHVFPAPEQPQSQQEQVGTDYRQFLRPDIDQTSTPVPEVPSTSISRKSQYKDATSRSLALGEQAFVGTVFDLISKEDKERMDASKKAEQPHSSSDIVTIEPIDETPASVPPQPEKPSAMEEQRQQNVPLYQGGLGFKPFIKNPKKQERYDRYLALVKQGHKAPYSAVMEDGVTEWEAEREREEFSKAATLYKPLANMMAARFTTGMGLDDDKVEKQMDKVEKSEAMKAAEMKMYGKLTRETHEWHPDKLVCKRFNVPNPYPGSSIIGLANVKRDKYSVFNFLDFANSAPPSDLPTDNKQENSSKGETQAEADKETETKAEKELNKFKKMKSIFSHLVEPGKDGDKNKKPGVSFSMKSAKPKQQKEFKSIFSHLDGEDAPKKKKPSCMETDSDEQSASDTSKQTSDKQTSDKDKSEGKIDSGAQNKDEKKEEEKSETEKDLFRAIFKNTDSEDSSSPESEEEEIVAESVPHVKHATSAPVAMVTVTMATETADLPIAASSSSEPMAHQPPIDDPQGRDTQSRSDTGQATLPGSGARIETVEDRLAPERESGEDSDCYGPALPPSLSQGDGAQAVVQTSAVYIDLTKDTPKKHRHKDKHKRKKDKKEKHKKSKHKKKHKKKESKKKRKKRHTSSDSSDTSDKESDDDADNMPSDRELLSRMKMLKPGKSAADFF